MFNQFRTEQVGGAVQTQGGIHLNSLLIIASGLGDQSSRV